MIRSIRSFTKVAARLAVAVLVVSSVAPAAVVAVPEIDGASAANALALLGGALMVLRNRRKR